MTLRRTPAAIAAVALLGLSPFARAQTVTDKPAVKQEVLGKVTDLLSRFAYVPGVEFSKWDEFLEAEREKLDAAKSDDEFAMAVNEALSKFGASHIVLSTPRSADTRRTASTVGIGIATRQTEKGLLILRVVPGAPADKVGLQPGDVIMEVDGKPTQGVRGIPGEENTTVTLKVKRANGDTDEVQIVRKRFSTVRPEELTFVDNDTVMLTVNTFDMTYDADRVESLMKKAKAKKNLILDLRDNGGGAVVNLQHLMGMFLPADTPMGTFVSRRGVERYKKETGGDGKDIFKVAEWTKEKLRSPRRTEVEPYSGRIAVLVNGGSGSASEMAAAALQELKGATVVGTKSAGAVLVSIIVPASNGFMLQYPLSDYVTVKGKRLEGSGVAPDVQVEEPPYRLPKDPDVVVAKAVERLRAVAIR